MRYVVAGGRGKCQHGDVAIEILHGRRPRQRPSKCRGPSTSVSLDGDLLHRQFRRDPRPAAAAPAGVVVHVDFQPEPLRLAAGVLDERPPEGAGEGRRPLRRALVGLHVEHSADADPLHGFQVGGDALA